MNWVQDNTNKHLKAEAERALKEYKKKHKGRPTKLIKVGSSPDTYKEVYIDKE